MTITQLATERKKKGITQAQLAKKMKTHNTYISRMETGTGKPDGEFLKQYRLTLSTMKGKKRK